MPRGNVRVSITGEAAGLKRATSEAEASLKKLGDKGAHHLGNLAKAAGGLAAAYVGIEAAKGAVETTESLAKSTLKLKRNFGLTAEAASTWSAVLKVNNIDQASALMSFTTLSKAINGGSKSAVQAFKDLGLSQKDLKDQDFGKTLDEVSAALTKMHGGAQRAADAQILLGRGAKLLAPLFRGDGLGFQEQAKWARQYGVTLDGHALKSSKDLTVATTQLKFAQMGMQILFTEKVIPTLTHVAEGAAKFIGQMRDGTGAGGRFADQMKSIWNQLQPVRSALKAIGEFLAQHPRLLAAAAGAFVLWKTAAVAASAVAKAKLIATFLGMGPKAAAGGVIAGTEFGTAAGGAATTELRALKWGGIGRFAGGLFALGFVAAALPEISKLTGGGLSGNDVITPTKRGLFDLKQEPHGINSPGRGTQFPKLHKKKPKHGAATGALITGPRGAGDIVPAMLKPGEVVLNENQQGMLGRGRIADVLHRTGARLIGPGTKAASGGLVGGTADLYGYLSRLGFRPTSTTGGRHAPNSYHYRGEAIDYGNSVNNIARLANVLWPYRGQFAELFIPTSAPHGGLYHFGSPFSDPVLQAQHQDHIHVADTAGSFSPRGRATGGLLAPGGRAARKPKRHRIVATKGGSTGFLPGVGPFVNGQPIDLPTDLIDTSGGLGMDTGGGTDSTSQDQINALNGLNAQLQLLNELLTKQAADRQKLLNVSQSQYQGLFAGFVDAISGGIGGRVGLGFMTPSTAGSFASY